MEILVVIAYAAILALVAPFVFPPSEHYGKLVPAGIALVSGAGAWLTLTWLGFHYDEAWIWFIVMIAMAACCVVWHQGHRGNQEKTGRS
ncbi:MAG: hypothetical protein EBW45_05990 [Actinobacteria bacterium]|nr:hypothetical protein [Actinomycetota bacterium]